jgi:hypothetical protein
MVRDRLDRFPSGRGGVGVEMESSAQCCPAYLMVPAGRRHALVPVGCAGQPGPARVSVSLRTLARRTCGSGGGGCPASPGRGACGAAPGGAGLGPVPAGLCGGRFDHGLGFEFVHHAADDHGAAGAVGHGLGLVGEAAGGDALPRPRVAVALPATLGVGADGPFPARCGGPVGGLAVAQRDQTAGTVPGGAVIGSTTPPRKGHEFDPRTRIRHQHSCSASRRRTTHHYRFQRKQMTSRCPHRCRWRGTSPEWPRPMRIYGTSRQP